MKKVLFVDEANSVSGRFATRYACGAQRWKAMQALMYHGRGVLIALMLFAATPGWAGSIFLTGHDPDFHAVTGPDAAVVQNFNRVAINFVTDPAFNPFVPLASKFLFVESQIPIPGGHIDGVDGLIASGFASGTDFDLVTASTLNPAIDQLGTIYSAIVVASDFGGLLTQAELDILNARSGDIISFLNQGGGLYAMAGSNTGAGLTPGGGQFGFLPFVVTSTAIGYCGPISTTPFGTSLGLMDFNVCADHNFFNDTFGLSVVDFIPGSGEIISLAGRGTVSGGGVTPVPEASTALLLSMGLVGLLGDRWRRRGRKDRD